MRYSHRINYCYQKDDVMFGRILDYIRSNRDAIDEIILFFEETHAAYQTDCMLEEETTVCRKRIQQLREAGVKSVGINVVATLGHKDEAWSWNEMPPFQTAMSPSGIVSFGQLCPRDKDAQAYIRKKYRAVIAADPDFIWMDDDMRVVYHEQGNMPCFCHRCVEKFNRIAGTKYRRESLVAALKNPGNRELRRQWIRYNLDSYRDICLMVREEVQASGKNIKLGLMTVHPEQNTKMFCDINVLVDALGAEMIRPGGGFYRDYYFSSITNKIGGVAFQNAIADAVPDRVYELEDFPAPVQRKSVRSHVTESTLAIMAGCDGITTNSMPPCNGTGAIYKALEQQRSCHEQIAKRMRETRLVGARPAFSMDFDVHIKNTDFFYSQTNPGEAAEAVINRENLFLFTGFAPMADPLYKDAWITFLSGEMAWAIPDKELERMLSRGVLMDGDAAAILCERGYSELIGCTLGAYYDNGVAEVYTSHPLNGEAALERRDTRMNYENTCTAMCLNPLNGAEALTDMISMRGEKLGTASIAFENRLGGRCIVMGYDPWRFPYMWHRERQLRKVFDWLWNGHAPYTGIKSPDIFQLYRESADREKFVMMLTNMWEDDSGENVIEFANAFPGTLRMYRGKGEFTDVAAEDTWIENGKRYVRIPSMASHTFVLLMNA